MILVEGPDGAGKSTLVDQLVNAFGLVVGERGTKDRDKLWTVTRQDTYTALSDAIRGNEPPVIWDRLYYSELVYHKIVGRDCQFGESAKFFIENLIDAIYPPVVVCLPPFEVVEENARKEHQMEGVNHNLRQIYGDYCKMRFAGNVMYYDYTGMCTGRKWRSLETVGRIIEHYIDTRSYREW